MFNDVNEVRLLGNITDEPELKFTPSGSAILTFSVATNYRYKKEEEWISEPTYHNIVIWGQKGSGLVEKIQKGTKVYVAGRIQTRSWDGNDGKKQYRTEIIANDVSLLGKYKIQPEADTLPF